MFNVLSSATEARPAGARGCGELVGVREKGCNLLLLWDAACSISISSRHVAMANLIGVRTASIFGD